MRTTTAILLATATLLAGAGCATGKNDTTGPIVGVPIDAPDHFRVAASGVGQSVDPTPGEPCRNPMVDPRTKTLLTLRRTADGKGDYMVEPDTGDGRKYGSTSRQLVRIDCATGKALGIVDE